MPKIGLKLWSTNVQYIPVARALFVRKVFDYIELFVVPGSIETIPQWKALGILYVLHAPHSAVGLNPAKPELRNMNIELVRQVDTFFSALNPEFVIFHPGIDGNLKESISQFCFFGERFPSMYQKVVIENNPQIGVNDERCLGASPEEIRLLCEGARCWFCLDFGHAICYAAAFRQSWKSVVNDFLKYAPVIFHISDGDVMGVKDQHEHLGDGNYNLEWIIGRLPKDSLLTVETRKDSEVYLNDFEQDVIYLRKIVL